MIRKLIEYRVIFVVIICLLSIKFEAPPFHLYYYRDPPIMHYFLINLINLLIFLVPVDKFIFVEKLVFGGIVTIVTSMLTVIVVGNVMRLIYGTDSNWDELKSPELLDSTLFYLVNYLFGVGIFKIWLRYRKPIYS
jgi:hypothetical protein